MAVCSICGRNTELREEICDDCKQDTTLGTTNPQTSDQQNPTEELKQVYQDFAEPVRRNSTPFGCLMMLAILGGIITCFYVSWLLGIIGGVVVLVILVYISDRVDAPHKERAKERISQLEALHGLSHQESFDLLFATRPAATEGDKHQWKTFVTEIWGTAALTSAQKTGQVPLPGQESIAEATSDPTTCPRCKSGSINRKSELKTSTAGHVAGQALFGILGNIALGAAMGRTIERCECRSCGHKWVNDKPKG